jgi:hypothetical protein
MLTPTAAPPAAMFRLSEGSSAVLELVAVVVALLRRIYVAAPSEVSPDMVIVTVAVVPVGTSAM